MAPAEAHLAHAASDAPAWMSARRAFDGTSSCHASRRGCCGPQCVDEVVVLATAELWGHGGAECGSEEVGSRGGGRAWVQEGSGTMRGGSTGESRSRPMARRRRSRMAAKPFEAAGNARAACSKVGLQAVRRWISVPDGASANNDWELAPAWTMPAALHNWHSVVSASPAEWRRV